MRKTNVMKTLSCSLSVLFLVIGLQLSAQYTTPGNNLSLSLDDLVSHSAGTVTHDGDTYFIHNTLTIAATDTLKITTPETVRTAANIRIEVAGTVLSDPASGKVLFSAMDTTSAAQNFRGFRFEDSNGNVFRNTDVTHGGGLQLISSEALFEYCTFRKNGSSNVSAAITYSSCDPIIRYCYFIENERSAIGSGANVLGSPQIMHSTFLHNTTDNSNRPQINLGPGGADTLYIVGNYIEGINDNAGGIGISNLVGAGSTKAAIRNNYIVNNRYGYAQIGSNISSVITDNVLKDNNIQNQPMLGGSGLNFQAAGSGNTAKIRRNLISGNLWGITVIDQAQPDMGSGFDTGKNVFFDNGNSGQVYALYNNTALTLNAMGNYWGTNDVAQAEEYIFHQPDDPSLGLVLYEPIMQLHPVIEGFAFLAEDNPALDEDVYGTINHADNSIELILPAGTVLDQLFPKIVTPLGVTVSPESGMPQDFNDPVDYSASVPHGEQQDWTVYVSLAGETFDLSFLISDVESGQPLEGVMVTLEGHGELFSDAGGQLVFEALSPGEYAWEASLDGYFPEEGLAELIDQDLLIEVEMEMTVGLQSKEAGGLYVYPNPAVDYVHIRHAGATITSWKIVDVHGKEMLKLNEDITRQRIDISNWPSGIYIIVYTLNNTQRQHKLLKP